LNGTPRVLYRLPELHGERRVFVVEGEKDADKLRAEKIPATCNPFGAGKWISSYTAQLTAAGCREIVIVPDNDPPGMTHARTVARACVDAGLAVKLIALPELPAKGDVSDYLAKHTAAELLALVDAAPLYRADQPVAAAPALTFTSMTEFLDEPEQPITWLVEGRIPAGAVILFVGAPKAGKSTCVRELALAVARGEPWLGWPTTPGAVWLLAFEDRRTDVRAHFRALGATGDEPLRLFVGQAPNDLLPHLIALASTERPAMIIIDTLARAVRLRDFNDYGAVSAAMTPWLQLARVTGATLVLVHHASAHADRDGIGAILGSTAFAGSVDNILLIRRIDGRRVFSTVQRVGSDLEPVIVTLNTAGRLECAGTKRLFDERELRDRLADALAAAAEPVRESWLHDQVDGRRADKVKALRVLLSQQRAVRTGKGGRGDPYLYSYVPAAENTGSRTPENGNSSRAGREPAISQKKSMGVLLFDASPILVPDPIKQEREPETDQNVRTSFGRPSSYHDPILVPEGPPIAQREPTKTHETHDKQGSDSGSQTSEISEVLDDAERF